jgi:hypothetical protein
MLMVKIFKDFGVADPSAMVPDPAGLEVASQMAHQTAEHAVAMQAAQQIQQQQQSQGGQPQLPAQAGQPAQPPNPAQQGPVQ